MFRNSSPVDTESILRSAACKLYLSSSKSNLDFIIEESGLSKKPSGERDVYRHFKSIFDNNQALKPCGASTIFAIVDFFLNREHACAVLKNVDQGDGASSSTTLASWPCRINYDGEIRKYKFYSRQLEMSILLERNPDLTDSFYYLCLSFSDSPALYYIAEVPTKLVPIFSEVTEMEDDSKLGQLDILVTQAMCDYCRRVLKNLSIPVKLKDFSTEGVSPYFLEDTKSSSPKKKRKASEMTTEKKQVEHQFSPYYIKLRDSYCALPSKPDSVTKLFSLLYHFFLARGMKSQSTEVWPVGVSYKSTVVDLWMYRYGDNSQLPVVLNMALLKNEKEFFLSLRFVFDPEKKCVQKLVPALVPSFNKNDFEKESHKIASINNFVYDIFKKFVLKVVNETTSSSSSVSVRSVEGTPRSDSRASTGSVEIQIQETDFPMNP